MSTTNPTPILLSATPTVTAGGMRIDLVFNTAMAAGSGTITITDGAVQTVIDRVTGQPAMRVVGATDTHTISAASVGIDSTGTHVMLDVAGLLPGHDYSVVMGNGVLVSSANVAFGGVRSTSQVQFSTAPAADGEGPALVSHSIDASLLKAGGSLQVTLVFSEPVSDLTADALNAPNAAVGTLVPLGDGHAWLATLLPSGAVEQPSNVLTIDMGKVHDAAGNAGKGIGNVASYSVDTRGPSATIALDGSELTSGHDTLVATVSFSEAVASLDAAALQAGHAAITNISGSADGKTWQVTLKADGAVSAAGNVLSLDLGQVRDLAGNPGSGTLASDAYAIDTQGPGGASIALDGSLLRAGGSLRVTFTFSEAIKALPAGAITAPHATVGELASSDGGRTWTGLLHASDPNTSSGNTISVDMGQLQDLKGNAGSGSFVSGASYAIDTVGPTVADLQMNGTVVSANEGIEVVIRFAEKVSLGADAILAPNATLLGLSTSDGGLTWHTILRPGASPVEAGGNVFSIDMSRVHDAAGNAGSGSVSAPSTYDVDTKGPSATITLDGGELLHGGAIAMTIVLSQRIADLSGLLRVPEGSSLLDAEGLGTLHTDDGGLTWQASLRSTLGTVDDQNALSLDLTGIHDAHGNAGTLVTSANYTIDGTVRPYVGHEIEILDWYGPHDDDYVSSIASQSFGGTVSETLGDGQSLMLSIDGGAEFALPGTAFDGNGWYYGMDFSDGVHTISARIVDGNGHGSARFSQQFSIDTAAPTMLTSPNGGAGGVGSDFVFTFDEAIYVVEGEGYSQLWLADAEGNAHAVQLLPDYLSADRKTLTIPAAQLALQSGRDYTFSLSGDITDLAGNPLADRADMHFHVSGTDTLAPRATGYATDSWAGPYGIGRQIDIGVAFSEAVQAAGSDPLFLLLSNGARAVYDHMDADGRRMVFRYTVTAGDHESGDLQVGYRASDESPLQIGLEGHVSDLAGNLLDAAHIDYSASLVNHSGYGSGIQVDAQAGPAPSAPALAAASDTGVTGDGLTGLHRPGFTGNGAASYARVDLFDESGTLLARTHANADNSWTISETDWLPGKSLDDGPHQLSVRQYDGANNESPASAALSLTVDSSIAPATVTLRSDDVKGSADGDLLTNARKPTFVGTGEAGAHIVVWDGSTIVGETTAGADGTYAVTSSHDLAQGQHTLTVEQTDLAGNTSPRAASQWVNFRIDFTEPDAPGRPALAAASDTGASDSDGITRDTTPLIGGTAAEAGGSVEIYDGASLIGTAAVGADRKWSFTVGSQPDKLAAFADGEHTLTVRQVDAYGNAGAASAGLTITVDTVAPTLVSTTPDWRNSKNWGALEFSEKIAFADTGIIDVLDDLSHPLRKHTGNVHLNWEIIPNDAGVADKVLALDLGNAIFGHLHLQISTGAITDLAGNEASIVGIPSFNLPYSS